MSTIIEWLQTAPLWQATLALLFENALILVLAVVVGEWAVHHYADRRIAEVAPPIEHFELLVAASSVFLNTVVTIVGLFLWRAGYIRFRTDTGIWAWLDVLALLAIMDLAMYVLHRVAHLPWLFPILHKMHHYYDKPRPLTLFILNPAENLAFGALWLAVIMIYPASWLGMSIYLVINVISGTIGHLGVEPFPGWWSHTPVFSSIAGSTFHARHHQHMHCNFGFYTSVWDRMMGTLRKE